MRAVTSPVASKVHSLEGLAEIVAKLKRDGKRVVHCHGVFDLVHPGHIRHFEAAKREGDVLVVTITPDRYVGKGPGRPVFTHELRAEFLANLSLIDYVAINKWPTAVETLKLLKPNVYVKGKEYSEPDEDLTGNIALERQAVEDGGGKILFTDDITFSSSSLINSHLSVFPPETEQFLRDFRGRHSAGEIIDRLQALKGLRVLVIGDTILDEYHFCSVVGKSPKANALNAQFLYSELYAGGVLAVANHVAGFCGEVELITCLGEQDPRKEFVLGHLKPNVGPHMITRPDAPTTVKRRIVETGRYTKMFEESFINDSLLPTAFERDLVKKINQTAGKFDIVLVADFGHGLISPATATAISESARFLAANAQVNSANFGYNLITKYPRVNYPCLDEPELRLANHDRSSPVADLMRRTAGQLRCGVMSVTQANRGSTTFSAETGVVKTPVFSTAVVDTLGAGDAYLAVTAPCAATNMSADLLGFVGNAAGALKVGIIGNKASVEPVPMFKFITTLLK